MAEATAKHKKELAKWKSDEQSTFVVFDVPGDGKFRVRNAVENLTSFRKKVAESKGFGGKHTPTSFAADKGKSYQSTIDSMITDGDIDNAVNLMELRGDTSPVFFGAGHGDHVTIYTRVSPIKIDGAEFIVGYNPLGGHKPWRVIEPKSAYGIGVQEKTKGLAIKDAQRVMKTMRNKYDDFMSTAEKLDQLDLLRRYVENNKK